MHKKEHKSTLSRPKKRGRPPFVPTDKDRDFVKAMVMAGVVQEDIAKVLKISEPTLRKHFAREVATALQMANAQVVASLFRNATGNGPGSVTAAIWWTKCRLGWRAPESERPPASDDIPDGYVGKKQIAHQEARAAGIGTEWGNDLLPPGTRAN